MNRNLIFISLCLLAACRMAEKQKPTVKVIGDNPLILNYGDTYLDPGASATDAKGATISDRIDKIGNVNTHRLGKYKVRYWATDKIKTLSDTVEREVVVKLNALSLTGYYTKTSTIKSASVPGYDMIKTNSGEENTFYLYYLTGVDSNWVKAEISGELKDVITVPSQNISRNGILYEVWGQGAIDAGVTTFNLTHYTRANGITDTCRTVFKKIE